VELPSTIGYAASFLTVGGATTAFGIGMVIASPALNLLSIGSAYQDGLNQIRDEAYKTAYAQGLMAAYYYADLESAHDYSPIHYGAMGNDAVNKQAYGHNAGFKAGFEDAKRRMRWNPDGAAQFFAVVVAAAAHENGTGAPGAKALRHTQHRAATGKATADERYRAVDDTWATAYKILDKQ
jgi:hypothetical protein